MRWGLAVAAVVMAAGLAMAQAPDSTTLLTRFLANLRASHLIPGSGVTPVVSSCGDGALQTGSTDASGRVVGTTQTACTITFGGTYGPNSADCFIENITANRGGVTAATNTAFTVSNLTAGDDFMYFCVGR